MKKKWIVWLTVAALCPALLSAAWASDEPEASAENTEAVEALPAEAPAEELTAETEESASEEAAAESAELVPDGEPEADEEEPFDNAFSARPGGEASDYGLVLVSYGENAELAVEVSGNDTSQVTYKWYRYVPDKWYSALVSRIVIPFATSASYTVRSVRQNGQYICVVKDGYGGEESVWFSVRIDSGLRAWVSGDDEDNDSESRRVDKGASVPLSVTATANDDAMPLAYAWSYYDASTGKTVSVGEDADAYTVPAVTGQAEYTCTVTDRFGNQAYVYFSISVENHFTAQAERDTVIVPSGEEGVLRVIAEADEGEITYQWAREIEVYNEEWEQYETEREELEGETGPALTVSDVDRAGAYVCDVSDPYETVSVTIRVEPENGLYAYAAGTERDETRIYVPLGETASLTVDAHADRGELTYRWWDNERIGDLDETSAVLTTPEVTETVVYTCQVTDMYGAERQVTFFVHVEDHFRVLPDGSYETVTEKIYPDDSEASAVNYITVQPGGTATLAVRVESDAGLEACQWYAAFDPVEGGTDLTLTLEDVREDGLYYLDAVNRFNEWAGVYFKVVVAYDPLDANRSGGIDAADAARFLINSDPRSAAEALKRAVGLPEWE